MTVQEKAEEFISRYYLMILQDRNFTHEATNNLAKTCALICVDEIIKECNQITQSNDSAPHYEYQYWEEVKQHISDL